jgi:hypothetical protein
MTNNTTKVIMKLPSHTGNRNCWIPVYSKMHWTPQENVQLNGRGSRHCVGGSRLQRYDRSALAYWAKAAAVIITSPCSHPADHADCLLLAPETSPSGRTVATQRHFLWSIAPMPSSITHLQRQFVPIIISDEHEMLKLQMKLSVATK